MLDPTELRTWVQKLKIKERARSLATLPAAIKLVAGLAIMNAVMGLFYEHPSFAMAGAQTTIPSQPSDSA